MADQAFDVTVNIILMVVFLLIILYMLFSIPVQKVYQINLRQPDGFQNYNQDLYENKILYLIILYISNEYY